MPSESRLDVKHQNVKHQIERLKPMKINMDMKKWKAVIQFFITVLTAVVTSLSTTSCVH